MNRREFLERSSGCMASAAAASSVAVASQAQETPSTPKPPRYKIDIEIFETRQDTWCHKKGEKFEYPKDMAKICPWLMSSMHDFIVGLQSGAIFPWKYTGTPYEKVIDLAGVTTEYVRCPDPTANLVAKITRTKVT